MCFKLLLPCPQIGNNAWEWSYGKHDEQEFTGLTILDGILIDGIAIIRVGIFWLGIFQMGIILGGSFPGCNFPGGSYPGWEFSRWELSSVGVFGVGIVWGDHPGGDFQRGSFPSTVLTSFTSCLFTYFRLSINIMSTFMSLFSFITDINGFFEIPTSPFIKLKKDIRKI